MIRMLGDMPPGVLGLEAVDDIEREDYERVIVPAVEAAIAEHGKVRLVYVLGHEFDDYEGEAVWEDIKLGVRHPASFERMAIVTDARWAGPRPRSSACCGPEKRAPSRSPSSTPPSAGRPNTRTTERAPLTAASERRHSPVAWKGAVARRLGSPLLSGVSASAKRAPARASGAPGPPAAVRA